MRLADRICAFFFRHNLRGATRLYTLLGGKKRLVVRTKHGVILAVDPYEYVDRFVLTCGYYEEEVLDAIRASLGPREVFWDVGANLGLHALTVARLQPKTKICAFEPNPAMAELIKEAISANQASVEVIELALDTQETTARFYLHQGNAGRSSLHNWDSDPTLRSIEVRTARGDELVARALAPAPHVIKIDVEGNEARVLQGMQNQLRAGRLHTIIFEDATEDTPAKRILREAGFVLRPLQRREATQHNLENYVATRKSIPGNRGAAGVPPAIT